MEIRPLIRSANIDVCRRRDEPALSCRIINPRCQSQLLSSINSGISEPSRTGLGRLRKNSYSLRTSSKPFSNAPHLPLQHLQRHCTRCRCLSSISRSLRNDFSCLCTISDAVAAGQNTIATARPVIAAAKADIATDCGSFAGREVVITSKKSPLHELRFALRKAKMSLLPVKSLLPEAR
jgi:hypothetical protein